MKVKGDAHGPTEDVFINTIISMGNSVQSDVLDAVHALDETRLNECCTDASLRVAEQCVTQTAERRGKNKEWFAH